MSEKTKPVACSKCIVGWQKTGQINCWSDDAEKDSAKPANCPSVNHKDVIEEAFTHYSGKGEDAKMAQVAARVEGLCYQPIPGSSAVNPRWTRVEDTIAFAKLMGYKKIGIATCIGLLDEANRLATILEAQGLAPESVCCKTGSIDKVKIGLAEEDKVRPGMFEPACNPIAQAQILNRAATDMNVIVGLCVGHDMLFTKHSNAPVTTLVVKDRVTGHNPVSVLYGYNFYYRRLTAQPIDVERG